MSKGPLPIFLIPCVLLLSMCASVDHNNIAPPANQCAAQGKGNVNLRRPIVCVDNAGGKVTAEPETIRSWDRVPFSRSKGMIHWVTRSGAGELSISHKDSSKPACFETPVCKNGYCRARALDVSKTEKTRQCWYSVTLDGVELDPEAIIVNCCHDQ